MKVIIVLLTWCIASLSVAAVASPEANNESDDSALYLYMPESSENGSFVIKVDHSYADMNSDNSIELWRSFNGGDFELISAHPQFNAISQMVYKQGTYAYQARLVHWKNGEKVSSSVSKTSYIQVNLRYPTNYIRPYLQASR